MKYIESLKESKNKIRFSADTIWKRKKEKLLNLVEAEMLNSYNGGKSCIFTLKGLLCDNLVNYLDNVLLSSWDYVKVENDEDNNT